MPAWTLIVTAIAAAQAAHPVAFIADDPAWVRAARARLGDRVLDVDTVKRAQVDAAKLGVKCAPGDAGCAAKIGVLAGADIVVVVRGGGAGAGAGVTFVSVDGTGKELHTSGPWPAGLDLDDVVDGVGAALEPKDGFILFKAPKKARFKVDGAAVKKARAAVAPGAHDVLVEKDGFIAYTDHVDVAAGAVVVVAPTLTEVTATSPPSPPQTTAALSPAPAPAVDGTSPAAPAPHGNPGLFWAVGAGAAGAVAAGAGVVAAGYSIALDDPNSDLRGHPAEIKEAWQNGQTVLVGAAVAAVAAGALGAVAVVLWE